MTGRRAAGVALAAYVLHRYDWSETSLILELFTREQGRVVAAAKGAKRPYSQLRSVLLPLQRVSVCLGRTPVGDEGASEIHNLRAAEYGGGAPMPGGAAILWGLYLNELLMKLLARHDPHPVLFDAYAQTLSALPERDDASAQAALRAFEVTLLQQIGLLPELGIETATQKVLDPERAYTLSPDSGLVSAGGSSAALPGAVWVALQAALEQPHPDALRAACRGHLAALRGILRGVLDYHLGTSQLRTRQVMKDVQRLLE